MTRTTRGAFAAALLAVFALVLGGLVSPATAATGTGKLKGTVTFAGKPLEAAKVQLFRYDYDTADDPERFEYRRVKTVKTDRTGRYSFSGLKIAKLKTGQQLVMYAILVTDRAGKAVKAVRYIQPKKGKTVTKNVRLSAAAVLTGTVSRSDGASPAELTVDLATDETSYGEIATPEFRPVTHATVQPDGTFRLEGVAAGHYAVVVRAEEYVPHCYNFGSHVLEKCNGSDAQVTALKSGETRALSPTVMTELAPAVSTLSGTVTDTAGKPLKGITVTVAAYDRFESVVTRASGRFTVKGRLEAGAYRVRFSDPKRIWAAGHLSSTLDLVPGQTIGNLDATLKSSVKVKTATKMGKGSAKVAFRITRKASGGAPSGTMTLSYQGLSESVAVKKGKVAVTLTGLPRGKRYVTAVYSGTSTTAGFTKSILVDPK